jgi:hypothetical protein
VVTKSPEAAAKKAASRASKCLKKTSVASTSLDAHRSMSSTDDVSTTIFLAYSFYCFELFFSCLTFDRLQ